jgi:hypothetical protein
MAVGHIRTRGPRGEPSDEDTVRLTLRFKPVELRGVVDGLLAGKVITAEEHREMLRQIEAERQRVRQQRSAA